MRIPNGMEVIFNNGGPDIPGVIEEQTPPNPALKPYIRVRFSRSAAWLDPHHVRVMTLADERRIFGKRFCDWHSMLWYTLIFYFGQGFQTLEREQLVTFWLAGWSEAATAKHLPLCRDGSASPQMRGTRRQHMRDRSSPTWDILLRPNILLGSLISRV
jgi:hypothetical protein